MNEFTRKYSSALRLVLAVVLLAIIVLVSGCAGSKPGQVTPARHGVSDLTAIPQDLTVFARQVGPDRVLMQPGDQHFHTERTVRRFFAPWRSVKPDGQLGRTLRANFGLKPGQAYTADGRPFPMEMWNNLVWNANAAAFPSRSQPAITVRNSSFRAMPTQQNFFLDPSKPGEGYPFDYFQQTAVWIGSPLYISHVSRDGQWLLAENSQAAGWIPLADVAFVDAAFMGAWQIAPLAAIIKDQVAVWPQGPEAMRRTGQPAAVTAHIGSLLPMGSATRSGQMEVLIPVRDAQGRADMARLPLSAAQAAILPLPATPGNIAAVGGQMMGQAYGWGGIDEKRDCSAMLHDLFVPFGLWLPRNSRAQAGYGLQINLAGYGPQEKAAQIVKAGRPFFSLIWMPGHIGLYLGTYENKAVFFHNIWGVRTNQPGASEPGTGREVIGRAVITTLRPGAELPNITYPDSLLFRIERLVNLPENK